MHDTSQPGSRLMSNYDNTMVAVLASYVELTDLEILSELKTGTQQYERYQLASYVVVYLPYTSTYCMHSLYTGPEICLCSPLLRQSLNDYLYLLIHLEKCGKFKGDLVGSVCGNQTLEANAKRKKCFQAKR